MYVKICGMTNIEEAREAVRAEADFIGFVFASSKRHVTAEQAANIANALPTAPNQKVGVFVNASYDTIIRTAETAELDFIQLHGDESPAFAKALPYPVIKAFRMGNDNTEDIQAYPCDYCLIDSPRGPNHGGNGIAFDWSLLADASLDIQKVILAGGLNAGNVQTAIATAQPAGVDVSSGVETNGAKDPEKINQFIKSVKGKG